MDFPSFERRAHELWESIPAGYREGVSRFVVERDATVHGPFEDGFAYGTCEPDPVVMAVPEAPVTSVIRIWYGSFVELAPTVPDFDWEDELWETVRHELQHHLEWRAGHDAMGEAEALEEENDRRLAGMDFDQDFYLHGVRLPDGWLAGGDLFVEVALPEPELAAQIGRPLEVRVAGQVVCSEHPVEPAGVGELVFYPTAPDAIPAGPWREIVLVLGTVREGALTRLRRWLRSFGG